MYELFSRHKRLRTVARLLNEAGYRTRNGSKFTDTTVKRLIRDPTAKGKRRANYTKSLGDKKHWKLRPETDWVWNEIPGIVSPELWDECNALLDERSCEPRTRPGKRAAHLFSGRVFCGCGERMYVPSNTPKYVCKTCRIKIPEVDVERLFHAQLKSFFCSPEAVMSHFEEGDRVLQEKTGLLSTLQAEQERVKKEMERLYRLYMGDHITPDGFGKNYRPLEERAAQLEEELPRLQAEVDFLKIQLVGSEDVVDATRDFYTRWPELPFEERRTVVESLVDRITVAAGEVSLSLLYLPAALQILANEQRNVTDSSRRGERSGPGRRGGHGPGRR
jgi:site-specific DNA recombinase